MAKIEDIKKASGLTTPEVEAQRAAAQKAIYELWGEEIIAAQKAKAEYVPKPTPSPEPTPTYTPAPTPTPTPTPRTVGTYTDPITAKEVFTPKPTEAPKVGTYTKPVTAREVFDDAAQKARLRTEARTTIDESAGLPEEWKKSKEVTMDEAIYIGERLAAERTGKGAVESISKTIDGDKIQYHIKYKDEEKTYGLGLTQGIEKALPRELTSVWKETPIKISSKADRTQRFIDIFPQAVREVVKGIPRGAVLAVPSLIDFGVETGTAVATTGAEAIISLATKPAETIKEAGAGLALAGTAVTGAIISLPELAQKTREAVVETFVTEKKITPEEAVEVGTLGAEIAHKAGFIAGSAIVTFAAGKAIGKIKGKIFKPKTVGAAESDLLSKVTLDKKATTTGFGKGKFGTKTDLGGQVTTTADWQIKAVQQADKAPILETVTGGGRIVEQTPFLNLLGFKRVREFEFTKGALAKEIARIGEKGIVTSITKGKDYGAGLTAVQRIGKVTYPATKVIKGKITYPATEVTKTAYLGTGISVEAGGAAAGTAHKIIDTSILTKVRAGGVDEGVGLFLKVSPETKKKVIETALSAAKAAEKAHREVVKAVVTKPTPTLIAPAPPKEKVVSKVTAKTDIMELKVEPVSRTRVGVTTSQLIDTRVKKKPKVTTVTDVREKPDFERDVLITGGITPIVTTREDYLTGQVTKREQEVTTDIVETPRVPYEPPTTPITGLVTTPPPPPPPTGFLIQPPSPPTVSFRKTRAPSILKPRKKGAYMPSLIAEEFVIIGKPKQKLFTGIEIRPVPPAFAPKKRRKRKKKMQLIDL